MMPVDMRLLTRLEGPLEDTPPSTRPSSSASSNSSSTSGLPHRSTSMDSIHAEKDKTVGMEFIPTRNTRIEPKCNLDASRFIKTRPANLHVTAKQQLERVAAIKAIRKPSLQEEEEWQSTTKPSFDDGQDWQANLDKWKSSRRKMNEEAIERVIRVKESEQTTSHPLRRKSMTLRGRITAHDDDNNDISELLSSTIEMEPPLNHHQRDYTEAKYVDSDTKDTKSDPGFCTGSDTGSDGVFAEDSISDTSSALGDKKEAPDSLLDPPSREGETYDTHFSSSLSNQISSPSMTATTNAYDKAIEDYKQFAENSAKKRTLSINNEDEKREEKYVTDKSCPSVGTKVSDKLSFFHSEMGKEGSTHHKSVNRRRTPQVELDKRRSMFELRDIDKFDKKPHNRRSLDVTTSLKSKVASFENIPDSDNKPRGITPPRDLKFKEKLANFSTTVKTDYSVGSRKAFPNRDRNFNEKLKNFSRLENGERKSPERKDKNVAAAIPLKERIASFERLSPEHNLRDRSVSMECLSNSPKRLLASVPSDITYLKKAPSTPFMVVELDSCEEEEKTCIKERITREYHSSSSLVRTEEGSKSSSLKRDAYSEHFRTSSLDRPTSSSSSVYTSAASTFSRSPLDSSSILSSTSYKREEVFSTSKESSKCGSSPKLERTEGNAVLTHTVRAVELVPRTDEEHPNTVEYVPKAAKQFPVTNKPKVESDKPPPSPIIQPPPNPIIHLPPIPVMQPPPFPITQPPPSPISQPPTSPITQPPPIPITQPPPIPITQPPPIPITQPPPSPITQPPPSPIMQLPLSSVIQPAPPKPQLIKLVDKSQTGVFPKVDVSVGYSERIVGNPSDVDSSLDDDSKEYGDDDIDEVIQDYEYLSSATTTEVISEVHLYEKASDMTTLMKPPPLIPNESPVENFYENIVEEEPVYENIYEKVQDDSLESHSDRPPPPCSPDVQHHYQTLEDVKTEVENLTPPLPPKSKILSNYEVIDVTWTEDTGGGAPAAPPSMPPPPPPEEDLDEDMKDEGVHDPAPRSTLENEAMRSPLSTSHNIKKEIRKKMSDFLGSSPHEEEEMTLQPPPDVNELLRQERQAERLLLQKQSNLSLPKQEAEPHRPKYTWEDRMRADGPRTKDLNESSDHLEFHSKLEELEREMVKHDLDMMQRACASSSSELYSNTLSNVSPPLEYREAHQEEPPAVNHKPDNASSAQPKSSVVPPSTLPIQEFYTAPTLSDSSPKSGYVGFPDDTTPNGPSPYSPPELPLGMASASYVSSNVDQMYDQSPPELIPRKKKFPVPLPHESQLQNHNLQDSSDNNLRYSDVKANGAALDSGSSSLSGQPLSKQSILTLSAIPKPRLVDNDSWIMKRKPEAAGMRDYGKHWLIQEAEQRRIEQQDRTRQKTLPNSTPVAKSPQSPLNTAYQSHYQDMRSSFNTSAYNPSHPAITSPSSIPLPKNFSSSLPSPVTHSNSSNLVNNNWKKQTKTYQPPQELPQQKPLPESIINTLTQRVTGKNKNTNARMNGSLSSNYRSEDYHDYMNTEGLGGPPQPSFSNPQSYGSSGGGGSSAPPLPPPPQHGFVTPSQGLNNSPSHPQHGLPPYQANVPPPHAPPPPAPVNQSPPQPINSNEEQRLLSVSGKKKCSHCGEELGRGAAMIIESLRLFYHIPCFKCCVCSIQLGNGTSGADVRVRNHKLHCHNCYSNDEGMKFSKV